jgi:plastocyanin
MNKNLIIAIILIVIGVASFLYLDARSTDENNSMDITNTGQVHNKKTTTDDDKSAMEGEGIEDSNMDSTMPSGDGPTTGGEMVADDNAQPAESDMQTFEVSGVNFAFSTEEIRVKKGDKVKIVFTSESGFHDWVVDEFNAATEQIKAGNTTSVEFVADKTGNFEYYCSVGQHRAQGMVGRLIVE